MLNKTGELYVIAAPSGAGKSSQIRRLLEHFPNLAFSVSATTRQPRQGENNGEHYHFIDRDAFRERIGQGRFLEHAEVFGHYYGTDRAHVEQFWQQGRDVLLEIDVQGAAQVRISHPQACQIFILPPSMEVLKKRLVGRGTDQADVIARRLGEAQNEISACTDFDWLVVNDDFDQAAEQLASIVRAWPLRRKRQQSEQKTLLRELLANE
ncbi:MAG: guanylate kinase [Pseudomonadota bacterium]